MIRIVKYGHEHESSIDKMMQDISLEFPDKLSSDETFDTPLIPKPYWVALDNETVIGTVGVTATDDYAVLKRMMVKKEYRGQTIGLSKQLIEIAINWCLSINISTIYLGTMTQFKAAHAFYKKYGFKQIPKQELPSDFIKNPVDSIFFRFVRE